MLGTGYRYVSKFVLRAGADMFHLEPEPMKNGSAPQHWYDIKSTLLNALKLMYVGKSTK